MICLQAIEPAVSPAARPLAGSFGGQAAAKPTKFLGSTACFPGVGRLRQLWSARHQGQVQSFSIASGRLRPITKRRFGGSPGLSRGAEVLPSYGDRQSPLGSVDDWLRYRLQQDPSGVDHGRYPPATGVRGRCSPPPGGRMQRGRAAFIARSLARRTAPWETQWGQLDRSLGALLAQPAGSLAAGDALRRSSAIW